MKALDVVMAVLLVMGGINWGVVGLMNLDLVSSIFGDLSLAARLIYVSVGLGALYQALQWKAIQKRWGLASA